MNEQSPESQAQGPEDYPKSTTSTSDLKSNQCYICRGEGHWARDCTSLPSIYLSDDAPRCYRCNGVGHFARFCPNLYQLIRSGSGRQRRYSLPVLNESYLQSQNMYNTSAFVDPDELLPFYYYIPPTPSSPPGSTEEDLTGQDYFQAYQEGYFLVKPEADEIKMQSNGKPSETEPRQSSQPI